MESRMQYLGDSASQSSLICNVTLLAFPTEKEEELNDFFKTP